MLAWKCKFCRGNPETTVWLPRIEPTVYRWTMDRPGQAKSKRSERARRPGDAPAVILSAASAALCGVALGLFERTPAGMRPFLQPPAIPESGWLSAPTARHRAFEAVQESASM